MFAVTADHHLWDHRLAGWSLLSGGSFASIGATKNASGQGGLFGVLADGSLWEYTPAFAGNPWQEVAVIGVRTGASAAAVRRGERESDFEGSEGIRPEGLEPPTCGSEDRCSIQLSYGRDNIAYATIPRLNRKPAAVHSSVSAATSTSTVIECRPPPRFTPLIGLTSS